MSDATPPPLTHGWSTTVRAGVRAAVLVALIAGAFDGLVRTLGIDPGLFLIRWEHKGAWNAFTHGTPALSDLPGLAGCTAAAVLLYAGAVLVPALLLALASHPLLRKRKDSFSDQLAVWLGLWLFLEVYWWTRSVVLPGLPATHPMRLAAAAGLLGGSLVIGILISRVHRRCPARACRCLPLVGAAIVLVGAGFLWHDRSQSAASLGRIFQQY